MATPYVVQGGVEVPVTAYIVQGGVEVPLTSVMVQGEVPSPAEDWYAIWDFEDQSDGTLTPPSGWSVKGTGTVVAANAAALHGSLGLDVNASGTWVHVATDDVNTASDTVIDLYFRLTSLSSNSQIVSLLDGGGTLLGNARVKASNSSLQIRNGAMAVDTSNFAVSTNTWYRLSWRINNDDTQEARIYLGESATPLDTLTGPLTNATSRATIAIGAYFAGTVGHIDTIRLSEVLLDPYSP